eukprot:TRINITY_DN31214_c0_g1_i1.p1 TRINITY_DN31214_c0_g1~~TRINITY_DN31214_c0_g1_i1.p1  ORF type:complete len:198 (+),score=71.33 TRINITY_DN31214_c0_g1_i1:75-668(+)
MEAVCLMTGAVRVQLLSGPLKALADLEEPQLEAEIMAEAVKLAAEDKLGGFAVNSIERAAGGAAYRADVNFEGLLFGLRAMQRYAERAADGVSRTRAALERLEAVQKKLPAELASEVASIRDDIAAGVADADPDAAAAATAEPLPPPTPPPLSLFVEAPACSPAPVDPEEYGYVQIGGVGSESPGSPQSAADAETGE